MLDLLQKSFNELRERADNHKKLNTWFSSLSLEDKEKIKKNKSKLKNGK